MTVPRESERRAGSPPLPLGEGHNDRDVEDYDVHDVAFQVHEVALQLYDLQTLLREALLGREGSS